MLHTSPYWQTAQVAKAAYLDAFRDPAVTSAQKAHLRANYRAVMRVVITQTGMAELLNPRRRRAQSPIENPVERHQPAPGVTDRHHPAPGDADRPLTTTPSTAPFGGVSTVRRRRPRQP